MVYFACDGRISDLRYFFFLISFTADEMGDFCVLSTYFFIVRGRGREDLCTFVLGGRGGTVVYTIFFPPPPPSCINGIYMYVYRACIIIDFF